MGRVKLDMKKIEDSTKNQITYSKRRNGLFKKINELSILCDVDVALVTFSPSGRLNQFPKRKIISEVLKRYIDLPLDKRNYPIEEPQPLVDQLDHIKDHSTKIIFVNNEIKRYEKQIAISQLELQILDAELRSFDRTVNEGTTLTEIHWQENFLHGLLKQLMDKKDCIFTGSNIFDLSNFEMGIKRTNGSSLFNANIEDLNRGPQFYINNSQYHSVLNQADPWLHSSRTQYGHSFHGLFNQKMGSPAADYQFQTTANFMNYNNNSNSSSSFSFANSPFWDQFCSSSALPQPFQMPPPLYQPMLHQETLANENQAVTDEVSGVMFDPDEISWLNSVILNNSGDQNPNVPTPANSPARVSSAPSIYDPMFQGVGLHVDPFLREYDDLNNHNNNNNNLEHDSGVFHQEEMAHQEVISAFQASPPSDPSSEQIVNVNSIMSNHEEYPWTNFPPVPPPSDHIQFDEFLFEDMIIRDEIPEAMDIENKDEDDDDDAFDVDEFFTDIPDIMIDLDELGIL